MVSKSLFLLKFCTTGKQRFQTILINSKKISKNVKYEEIELLEDEEITLPATDDVKNFSYTIINNDIYFRENSIFIKKELKDKEKDKEISVHKHPGSDLQNCFYSGYDQNPLPLKVLQEGY